MIQTDRFILLTVSLMILLPAVLFAGGWGKTFGGPRNESAASARQISGGGFIVAGNFGNNAWLIKLRATSLVDWQKMYSAGSASGTAETADHGYGGAR